MKTAAEVLEVNCRPDGVPLAFRRPGSDELSALRRPSARSRTVPRSGPRWYSVRAVLATWSESGAWWRSAAASAPASGLSVSAEVSSPAVTSERTVWRVEARPNRSAGAALGVYDLAEINDQWWLVRRHD